MLLLRASVTRPEGVSLSFADLPRNPAASTTFSTTHSPSFSDSPTPFTICAAIIRPIANFPRKSSASPTHDHRTTPTASPLLQITMSPKGLFKCPVCKKVTRSNSGLMSHLAQSPACMKRARVLKGKRQPSPDRPPSPAPVPIEGYPAPVDDLGISGEPQPKRTRVSVEEVRDEGDSLPSRTVIHHPTAGKSFPGVHETHWEKRRKTDIADGRPPWTPFDSIDDWEAAKWLMTSGVPQEEMDKFLKLNIVSSSALFLCLSVLMVFS